MTHMKPVVFYIAMNTYPNAPLPNLFSNSKLLIENYRCDRDASLSLIVIGYFSNKLNYLLSCGLGVAI